MSILQDVKDQLDTAKREKEKTCIENHIKAILYAKERLNEIREQILDDLVEVNEEEEKFDKVLEALDKGELTVQDIRSVYCGVHPVDNEFCDNMIDLLEGKV